MEDKAIAKAILLAKENNQKAFALLYDAYWDYLFSYLLTRNLQEDMAEDLAIKTFSKAFDKISTYDSKYSFKTWLITISKNLQIDEHRKEKKQLHTINESIETSHIHNIIDENPSPEDMLITAQNLKGLLTQIKALKPIYSQVIKLRYLQELSYKEISQLMNLPLNTVKVTLLRAKKILAEKIINEKI